MNFFDRSMLVSLASLFALTTACTGPRGPDRDTIVVGLASSPATLDPRFATDAGGMRLTGLLFSSLVRSGADLQIEGDAASRWEYKDKVYTFHLRPGLKFSNGRPVTAEDIEFTLKEFTGPKSPFASSFRMIEKFEVRYDDHDRWVKLTLNRFSAALLRDLSPVKILPKKEVLEAGDAFGRKVIGSGPFEFVSQDSNEIRIKARLDHPYSAPKIGNAVFKVVRDDNTRFLKLLKGELDLTQQELPPNKISELEKKGGFTIVKQPGLSMTYLLLNLRDPLLSKKEVREALARAINREDIIRYKLDGLASPATSLLSPANPYFATGLTAIPFEPEQSKSKLLASGANGPELVLKTSNTPSAVENGRVIANQLEALGLKIKLQSFEWGTYYGDIQKGNFQIATMRWVGTIDPDLYRLAFHTKEIPPEGRNRGHYSNQRLDRLLDEGLSIEDDKKRTEHYGQVQKIVLEDLPIIPLWYDTEVAVLNPRVKGYFLPKNGDYSALIKVYKE